MQKLGRDIINTSRVNPHDLQRMYDMYVDSYGKAGEKLWFKSPEDLQRYPCSYVVRYEGDKLLCYIMYQLRKHANKISLIVHDGTREGKDQVMDLVASLLAKRGWILEASGAVSWVLRKKNVPYIETQEMIEKLLDIKNSDSERVIMNSNFTYGNKDTNKYVHSYYKDGVVMFENNETLFGIGGCRFNEDVCGRMCIV